jgi:phosphoribosylformylglycinamidine cyclo-ligase
MAARLTYKSAGVDIDLKERLIPLVGRLARGTSGAHVLEGIGGFGAIIGLNGAKKMKVPVLVAGTDGVGTKLKIAFALDRHDTIGIDCVAMCVNDIVCHNARPLFFLDYIGCGKLDERLALAIVKGIAKGCAQAAMALVGGETAQMPGLYKPGEYDVAGFAVGLAEQSLIPDPAKMRAGDLVIGFASVGLHSNGYSLARKVLIERAKLKLDARVAELGGTLGDELIRPTRIYVKTALELFSRFTIKGLANITGGGVIENLPRVMPKNLHATIERGSWPVPPIFDLIARLGKIEQSEMDRTFNNGLGMVAIAGRDQADGVVKHLRSHKQRAFIIGAVTRGTAGVTIK